MDSSEFVVVDVETTGLSSEQHHLTEVAMVKVRNGRIIDEFEALINPGVRIPRFITRLTGIDNELVKDEPKIDEVAPKIKSFIGKNAVFVGHNATFDYGFISANLEKCGYGALVNPPLCTCKLARRVFSGLPSYRLSSVCESLEIGAENYHRAKADTVATYALLNRILDICRDQKLTKIDELLRLQYMPIANAKKKLFG